MGEQLPLNSLKVNRVQFEVVIVNRSMMANSIVAPTVAYAMMFKKVGPRLRDFTAAARVIQVCNYVT